MHYRSAKAFILGRLRRELSPQLRYHGLRHTLDVLRMATSLCLSEGIRGRNLKLVKTAALFHDSGFVHNRHAGHEQEGCSIVRSSLPEFGYSKEDIELICGMIMSTKIPQSPTTLMERILCDADLDYLGRTDFEKIGNDLFLELMSYNLITDEYAWNQLQVTFLTDHRFHTQTNIALREPIKLSYLKRLEALLETY